jgi:outer membrane receptor protein involved in Fe transport
VFDELIDGVRYEATQTIMGDGEARYAGFEVSLQQKLGVLAPALDDLSIFGNYNYTWSEATVDGRDVPLTNSPKHIVNLSLLYDNYDAGVSFVVALNYRDALLTGVGENPFRDQYFDSELHLDLAATVRLTDRLKAVAAVNGLTARREREVLGAPGSSSSRLLQYEEYGPYATVALQYSIW